MLIVIIHIRYINNSVARMLIYNLDVLERHGANAIHYELQRATGRNRHHGGQGDRRARLL